MAVAAPPTNAPASIGAIAAGIQAVELEKILSFEAEENTLIGREILYDLRHFSHTLTRLRRFTGCRFDHRVLPISAVAAAATLGDLVAAAIALEEAGAAANAANPVGATVVSVEAGGFARKIRCTGCGQIRTGLWVCGRGFARLPACQSCAQPTAADGSDVAAELELGSGDGRADPGLGLYDIGIGSGDVVCVQRYGYPPRYLQVGNPGEEYLAGTVVIAGCGNIGSHLAGLVARNPRVGRVVLVDPDVYEPANLSGQAVRGCDVFRAKAEVQAEVCGRIRPDLEVRAIVGRIEDLPLGVLRGAVLVSCLDSRVARQAANEKAWRIGIPLIDAAVDAAGLLVRVCVYRPERGAACLECGWDDDDYALLETVMPCAKAASDEKSHGATTCPPNAPPLGCADLTGRSPVAGVRVSSAVAPRPAALGWTYRSDSAHGDGSYRDTGPNKGNGEKL